MPTSAHPWNVSSPTQFSFHAHSGAVMPENAIDHNVTATVNVKMPIGSITMQ